MVAKSHIWTTIQSNVQFLPKALSPVSMSEEPRLCGVGSGGHAQEQALGDGMKGYCENHTQPGGGGTQADF